MLVQKKIKSVWINGGPRLPSAFQEVEYIQSSGTQWINTLVTPTQSTKSQIKFKNLETTGYVIYGLYSGSDTTDYRLFNNSSGCYFDFGSSRINVSGGLPANTIFELELGNYYVKDMTTGTNIVSGTTISSYTGPSTITLNNFNNSSYSKNIWYYVKIYNGTTLIRDFVPCYRKSDNVIGMYDLVNNQFYTNSGTGTFSKGADVSDMSNMIKVRPSGLEFSYNFAGGSLEGFQAAGGYNINGYWSIDSNGLLADTSTNKEATALVDLGQGWAARHSKLTITQYCFWNGGSWKGGPIIGITSDGTDQFFRPGYSFNANGNNNSGYKASGIFYRNSSGSDTDLNRTQTQVSGTNTLTLEINLSSGYMTGTLSGAQSGTWSYTLSSSQLTELKSMNYVCYNMGHGNDNSGRIYTISLKLE